MNLFTKNNKLISVVRSNYQILPVLNRFGIKLGVKDETIESICKTNNINTDFFLAIINTYSNEHYFPKEELGAFDLSLIIEYLIKTHAYYAKHVLPSIEDALEKLLASSNEDNASAQLIRKFYKSYKEDFLAHNQNEEKLLFPYLTKENIKLQNFNFEEEHVDSEEKLQDFKNVLLKYLEGNFDEDLYNELIFKIIMFEKDSQDHTRIENMILFPLAQKLNNK